MNSGGDNSRRKLCVVTPYEPALTETFIRAHIEKLPANIVNVHGWRPSIGSSPVLPSWRIGVYKLLRSLSSADLKREITAAYVKAFRDNQVDAVLAEYGDTGVLTVAACRAMRLPLIVHFHGYDASVKSVLESHAHTYPEMFRSAAAVVAVSRAMQRKLASLGAPPEKLYYNPYGIDCARFGGARPGDADPIFVAVGRFVEKKAPHLTIRAFGLMHQDAPGARLHMIGEGPLYEDCRRLAVQLGLADHVLFLGPQPHDVVHSEMKKARCFVQHSVEAASGDSEGTPLGILEAGASGLPVVSTRHAGIPDVVIEGETGLLVDERDVEGMAASMLQVATDSYLASRMGAAARARVQEHFSLEKSIAGLWQIIESSIASNGNRL